MKRILLTCGRAPVTLELARIFHAAGHLVFVADSLPWHFCRGSRAVAGVFTVPPPNRAPQPYLDALVEIVRRQQIDLVLPICEEIFHVARGLELLSRWCTVFTEPLARLHALHNKWAFFQLARQHGLPTPDTSLVSAPEEVYPLLARPIVLKPVYSRFASKTVILPRQPADVPPTISPQSPWVAQAFAPGRQICTFSIAHRGRLTAHSDYAADFVMGHGTAIVFRPERHAGARAWVERLVAETQFTGQIAFDFIDTGGGEVVALECNPRTTSGIHLLAGLPTLADAFFEPSLPCLEPPPGQAAMVLIPMLLYGLPASRTWPRLRAWLSAVSRSRDVTFSWRDPVPGLLSQWVMLAHLLGRGQRAHVNLQEVSTQDIEWNGEDFTWSG